MNKQPYCGMDFGSGPSKTAFLKVKIDCKHAHGRARVISGEGCVIAWWEAGENEATPSIKASAINRGRGTWEVHCAVGDSLFGEMTVYGGSSRVARSICRHLVKALRGVIGKNQRRRINKGLLLEAPRVEPLTPEEELADTIARQKEAE